MNMTPEQIQAILAAGTEDPEADNLRRRQEMINQMRQRALSGGGEQQMAGGLVVPNWGTAVGNFAQGMMANKMQPAVDQGMRAMTQRGVDARKQYLDMLMAGLRTKQAQLPQPALPPAAPQDPVVY